MQLFFIAQNLRCEGKPLHMQHWCVDGLLFDMLCVDGLLVICCVLMGCLICCVLMGC